MAFEVFKKSSAPLTKVPTVTVQKRGNISLNRSAYEMLGAPEAVELLWDANRSAIGLRAADIASPNAYPARPVGAKTSAGPLLIAGMAFTKFYGIDTTQARRYVPTLEGEVLVVELSGPSQLVTSNRDRTARADRESG